MSEPLPESVGGDPSKDASDARAREHAEPESESATEPESESESATESESESESETESESESEPESESESESETESETETESESETESETETETESESETESASASESRDPSPESRDPSPESRGPSPESRDPSPESRDPSPESRVPSPESRDPSPESRDPSPESENEPKAESVPPCSADDPPDLDDAAVYLIRSARLRRIAWGVGGVAALWAIVLLADQVRSVTVPLLIAYAIAYILDPVVDRFEERGINRTRAILILLGGFFVVGTVAGLLVIPQLLQEFGQLPGKLEQALHQAIPKAEALLNVKAPDNLKDLFAAAAKELNPQTMKEFQQLAGPLTRILIAVSGGTKNFFASLGGLLLIPFFTFYLLRDFDIITARLAELIPLKYREPILGRVREADGAMSAFIRGQLTVASILSVLYAIGLSILGVPLGLVVGIFAGLGNMVPYLGTTLGLVLATLMVVLEWQGLGHLAMVYGVFALVQTLEGWVLTPRIVGDSVGLSPFAVIIAVLVFGDLFGFFGLLIAVPFAAVVKIVVGVLLDAYKASDFYQEGVQI